MIEAIVFEKAADLIKDEIFSCHAIENIDGSYFNELAFWIDIHSDTGNKFDFTDEIEDAAKFAKLDIEVFRIQFLKEMALSLRKQGFSK